jgi:hypothetical protein
MNRQLAVLVAALSCSAFTGAAWQPKAVAVAAEGAGTEGYYVIAVEGSWFVDGKVPVQKGHELRGGSQLTVAAPAALTPGTPDARRIELFMYAEGAHYVYRCAEPAACDAAIVLKSEPLTGVRATLRRIFRAFALEFYPRQAPVPLIIGRASGVVPLNEGQPVIDQILADAIQGMHAGPAQRLSVSLCVKGDNMFETSKCQPITNGRRADELHAHTAKYFMNAKVSPGVYGIKLATDAKTSAADNVSWWIATEGQDYNNATSLYSAVMAAPFLKDLSGTQLSEAKIALLVTLFEESIAPKAFLTR